MWTRCSRWSECSQPSGPGWRGRERLRLIIQKLQRNQFGRRSESLDADQLRLGFDDLEADVARAEATLPSGTTTTPRSREDSPRLPDHLERVDRSLDLEHRVCPCCGGTLHAIGETISEVLDHVPARLRVIRIRRARYGCRACGTIHQAPAPDRPIAKGRATPALLAHVLVAKYADHLPLYRQSQIFARQGVDLGRSTLANWGWRRRLVAGTPACPAGRTCLRLTKAVRRRHPDSGARSRSRSHQDRPALGLCAR
jgi:transposase